MTQIEQIKAEIERLYEKASESSGEYRNGVQHTLITLKEFVDSLPQEPQGLDEAAEEYCLATDMESQYVRRIKAVAFKTGAKWEKEKIIKKACAYLEPVFKNYAGYNCGADELVSFENVMNED